jgi:2-polyprenyl-6-methoxyphenol hydroxylase-like FAD-dependent oxidoreductase
MVDHPVSVQNPNAPSGGPVLISGASFAGLATAYWLNRLGYRVTVVEVAGGLRKGGTPVDIEGETVGILERMGMFDAVRAKALPPRAFEFKDAQDRTLGGFGLETGPDAPPRTRFEIHRDDLLEVLFAGIDGSVELLFNRSIKELNDGREGVTVTLDDGTRRTYALVFGCDGNRSNTRKLVFGAEKNFTYFMGGYVYLKVVPVTGILPPNVSQVFSVPGRTAMLNGYDDRTDIGLAFRTEGEIEYDYRDRAQQRAMIHDYFDRLGWKVPSALTTIFTSTGSTRFGCRFGRKGGSRSWVTPATAYHRWQAWAARWRSSGRDGLLKPWNGTVPITQPPSRTITTNCAALSMRFRRGQPMTAWQ